MTTIKIRRYSELRKLKTFEERFEYLQLRGRIGESTFGFDRYLNQLFYSQPEWKAARRAVIIRDESCDLGIDEYDIKDRIYIHHMNPITIEQVEADLPLLYDPEFLICTSFASHQAIHYGDAALLPPKPIIRTRGDTRLW